MRDTVQEMADQFMIRAVLERYCRGVDRLDAALIDSVYWDGATDNHGPYTGPGKDFSAYIIPRLRETYWMTMHAISQSNIVVSQDRAAGDTYFLAHHVRRAADGDFVDVAVGRYVDLFERRNGEWRIKDRLVVMDWMETRQTRETQSVRLEHLTSGRRDATDPSYDAIRRACGPRS
jgi:hypothetical protein